MDLGKKIDAGELARYLLENWSRHVAEDPDDPTVGRKVMDAVHRAAAEVLVAGDTATASYLCLLARALCYPAEVKVLNAALRRMPRVDDAIRSFLADQAERN